MRHSHDDGRGPRLVYLNGIEVEYVTECFEADVGGWVRYAPYPHRTACDEIVTRVEYGAVTVEFIKENE